MRNRGDFAEDIAATKARTDEEVANLLKLVNDEPAMTASNSRPIRNSEPEKTAAAKREPKIATPSDRQLEAPTRGPSRSRIRVTEDEKVVLENVTTRLPRDVNEFLTEAALRQRLKKSKPDTRQEIIEQALRQWFFAEGYGE